VCHRLTLRPALPRRTRGPGRTPVPKSEKKRHVIPFKVDDSELKALDRKAKELGLSRSEMIRLAI